MENKQTIFDRMDKKIARDPFIKQEAEPKTITTDLRKNIDAINESADKMLIGAIENNRKKMRVNLEKLRLPQQRIDELVNKVETGEIDNDPAYMANNRRIKLVTNEINKRTDDTLNSLPNNSIVEEIRARINKSR